MFEIIILEFLAKLLAGISMYTLTHDYYIWPDSVRVSWYEYGDITANGEVYYPDNLTCASYDLPFNTILHLKYKNNEVVCRVNDRGPFATDSTGRAEYPLRRHPDRDLDLSRGTYRALFEELDSGVSNIKITKVEFP